MCPRALMFLCAFDEGTSLAPCIFHIALLRFPSREDSLSIWLSGFLSSVFPVILCFLHFLACSSEKVFG